MKGCVFLFFICQSEVENNVWIHESKLGGKKCVNLHGMKRIIKGKGMTYSSGGYLESGEIVLRWKQHLVFIAICRSMLYVVCNILNCFF